MKIIKFDLPLNGTKVHNLEELRDNFTTEILEHHASGVLLKWLNSRNLTIEAEKLSAIAVNHNPADNLVALCDIFGIEADRQVIEAALSKSQPSQGVTLREDPEELKCREKLEKLTKLLDGLKSKRLYITQDDYNLFVKDKIQIEQEGKIERVGYCMRGNEYMLKNLKYVGFNPKKSIGDIVEVGDTLGSLQFSSYGGKGSGGILPEIKSPLRGVLVAIGEISLQHQDYDSICYIRIDHDTDPTIKIITG